MKVLRILLVEDSFLDAELIGANLAAGDINCELVRVETRADFLIALEQHSFDLILSDVSLPSFNGFSALEIARNTCPEVPFIFVSGALGEVLAIETLKSGATDYVLKHGLDRLVPSVHRALREANERRERKQAEAEKTRLIASLKESESRFRRLVESNIIGCIFWDVSGQITDANDAFLRMVGYTQEELQAGKLNWKEMTPIEQRQWSEQSLAQMKQRGSAPPLEKEYICKDGNRIPVLLGGVMFEGSVEHGVSFVLDLTERKQLENRLRQQADELAGANRIKDEFLAVLSHELRSPLNPILGWTQLLRSRKFDPATTAKAIEVIERNAKVQIQLIDDLLDVSRIIQGKISLNVSPVNLVSTIEAAIDTVRLAAEAKSIEIKCLVDSTVGLVSGDRNRLQQVVWNLLSNAIKFTPNGGLVIIRLARDNSHAQIQVNDSGKGIKADFLPYVFDYFRQADASTTRKHGGLGLGLAIVRHLVELHGGTVFADSPGEELGATFTVKLPLMSIPTKGRDSKEMSQTAEGAIAIDNYPPLEGLRVLIVDDEVDSREYLSLVLQECGAEVTAVASAIEAITTLELFKPDVLVSDIGMPGEDGYSLMRKVRARSPERGGKIPAAALTAYARAEDRTAALSAGFQIHIPKPVDPSELAIVVASLAGRNFRS